MKKKILVPILIIIFLFVGFTRIDGSDNIRPVLFAAILVLGMSLGVLFKNILDIYKGGKQKG